MKLIYLVFTALLTISAKAQVVPDGGFPFPFPAGDPCNKTYHGSYGRMRGNLDIQLQPLRRGQVDVTLVYQGQVYYGRGTCDNRNVNFWINGDYQHTGSFTWILPQNYLELRGTEYIRRRPYTEFQVESR